MTQSRGATAGTCTKGHEGGDVSEPYATAQFTADTRDEMPHHAWRHGGGRRGSRLSPEGIAHLKRTYNTIDMPHFS